MYLYLYHINFQLDSFCALKSPLHMAALTGNRIDLENALRNGEDINMIQSTVTPIYVACMKANYNIIQALVEHQCDVNAATVQLKQTALHCAASKGLLDIAVCLVKHHALLDVQDSYGATPLFLASQYGKTQLVQFLLTQGANCDIPDQKGLTPLAIATLNGKIDVTRLLIQNNANLEIPDNGGHSALLHSVKSGQRQICQVLIQAGASVNVKNAKGEYPILIAAMHGNVTIIDFLISAGCDVNVVSPTYETPIFLAVQRQHLTAVKKLIAGGADVCKSNHRQRTPLIEALHQTKAKADVVYELLANGSDIDDTCECHQVPMHALLSKRNGMVVAILVQSDTHVGIINRYQLEEMKEYCTVLYNELKEGDQPLALKALCRKSIKRYIGGVHYRQRIKCLKQAPYLEHYMLYGDVVTSDEMCTSFKENTRM